MSFRIVFIGATVLGIRCVREAATASGCEVVGIITAPRRFRISYRPEGVTNVLYADFTQYAAERRVPCVVMNGTMTDPEIVSVARNWRPNLFVVVGWYHMVPRLLREIAPAVGLHASLLPDYSGGAPLVWAMINGERRTGITLFYLGDGVDDGPIVAQAAEDIHDTDTIATLYFRIEEKGVELLRTNLPKLARGEAMGIAQDESRRRVFPQRSPDDGRISWEWHAHKIYDFIRAQTRPYPGAFTLWRGEPLRIWTARVINGTRPVTRHDVTRIEALPNMTNPVVRCRDGSALELVEVEFGGTSLSGEEFAKIAVRTGTNEESNVLGK
jgi:methionyl-tRNA formyltransferase